MIWVFMPVQAVGYARKPAPENVLPSNWINMDFIDPSLMKQSVIIVGNVKMFAISIFP